MKYGEFIAAHHFKALSTLKPNLIFVFWYLENQSVDSFVYKTPYSLYPDIWVRGIEKIVISFAFLYTLQWYATQ